MRCQKTAALQKTKDSKKNESKQQSTGRGALESVAVSNKLDRVKEWRLNLQDYAKLGVREEFVPCGLSSDTNAQCAESMLSSENMLFL